MGKKKYFVVWLLTIVMLIAMTGCASAGAEDTPGQSAETAAVETKSAAPAGKSRITVYVCPPADWDEANIWAWKDGGEDATDAWLGMDYTVGDSYFSEVLPGWIDRVTIRNFENGATIKGVALEPGKDVWIVIDGQETTVCYEDPQIVVDRTANKDPFYLAAQKEDFEAMKAMLPDIEDRSILTDWDYNDFNYAYATEAILNGDYDTAIEFFGYCAYEDNRLYGVIIQQLLDGDVKGAVDTITGMEYATLDIELDMSWAEIIYRISGTKVDPSDLNFILLDKYLVQCRRSVPSSFDKNSLAFGDSTWVSEGYVGEIGDPEYYPPVNNLKTLYGKCGAEANGKALILRSQKGFPNGKVYYAVDLMMMDRLCYDLYPASLSEVEYVILVEYAYDTAGKYKQTLSMGDNSVEDYFTFLNMKGRVQLIDPATGTAIYQSQWIKESGEPEAHFSDRNYQCSPMPETGGEIIHAVEMVRERNKAGS